ncbi:hypothetical protein EYC80_004189 [Monilinia laxa]|uniref:Uncharacterized protein n=1 Tax=Monilinia laxa TaxID=61186 RepID=A0A5N6KLY8_MONLA|nr:hypothetical protein EYC80_004189 [Monilinia laxa]
MFVIYKNKRVWRLIIAKNLDSYDIHEDFTNLDAPLRSAVDLKSFIYFLYDSLLTLWMDGTLSMAYMANEIRNLI